MDHRTDGGWRVFSIPGRLLRRFPRWAVAWTTTCTLASGFLALLWLVLRTGAKPSRLAYPCQRAALSAAWLAFGGPLAATFLAVRRRLFVGLRNPVGAAIAAAGLLVTVGVWGNASRTGYQGPPVRVPDAYRAQVFHTSGCPQSPVGDRFVGLDCLVNLMGQQGLKLHRSATTTTTSGPTGIIAPNDVVVIKINYQWDERGGSNTDLLRGLIRWIVDHPDGFTGEIVVAENSQFNSIDGFDRDYNNAEDPALSPHDVVVYFQGLGYRVSHFDWTVTRFTQVDEYSAGDMNDGYVVYPWNGSLNGAISYPKFRTGFGTYVSMRDGIYAGGSYDRAGLKMINLPVLKSHSATYGATACVKNYMGLVTDSLGTNSHDAIGSGIMGAVMGQIQPADLNILDAIWVNGDPYGGPWTGYSDATRRDELVASVDPVGADIWSVKNILIPTFLANGFSPPWPTPSADPDDPASDFRRYLDASMNWMLAAGYDATNDLASIDVYDTGCSGGGTPGALLVTGPGPAGTNPPLAATWTASAPPTASASWSAYGTNQAGVNVAGADIVGGSTWEVLTGPGPGPVFGPQVRGWLATGAPISKVNYYAYGTLRFGAHAAGAELDVDGHQEILSSPGPGGVFGPHVRGWNYDGAGLSAIARISFFAYSTLRFGARVAGGDLGGDGDAEIVTGAGAGTVFGPHVRGFDYDGSAVTALPISFFAHASGRYGAAVDTGDTYGDGTEEIVVGRGPDPANDGTVRGFNADGAVTDAFTFTAMALAGGPEVAAADIDADGAAEVVVGAGWGAANNTAVDGFAIVGGSGTAIPALAFVPYPGLSYGAKVGVVEAGP